MARHVYGYTKVFDGDADPEREDHYRYMGMTTTTSDNTAAHTNTNTVVAPGSVVHGGGNVSNMSNMRNGDRFGPGPDNSLEIDNMETRPGVTAVTGNSFHNV